MSKLPYLAGVALIASAIILPNAVAQASTDTAPGLNKIHKPAIQRTLDKIQAGKEKIKDARHFVKKRVDARMHKGRHGAFLGKVTAVNGSSFTVETKGRGTLTVKTDSTTVFRKGTLSDVTVGKVVLAKGVWDKADKSIMAKAVAIMPQR